MTSSEIVDIRIDSMYTFCILICTFSIFSKIRYDFTYTNLHHIHNLYFSLFCFNNKCTNTWMRTSRKSFMCMCRDKVRWRWGGSNRILCGKIEIVSQKSITNLSYVYNWCGCICMCVYIYVCVYLNGHYYRIICIKHVSKVMRNTVLKIKYAHIHNYIDRIIFSSIPYFKYKMCMMEMLFRFWPKQNAYSPTIVI